MLIVYQIYNTNNKFHFFFEQQSITSAFCHCTPSKPLFRADFSGITQNTPTKEFSVGVFALKVIKKYGEGGIRTHGTVSRTLVFKTSALNHSATSPKNLYKILY